MKNIVEFIKSHWIKPLIIIGLFLACLSTSILIKKWFDMDGDYLSAFATLAAAVVAAYLFNDWRVQHNKQIKDQYFVEILKIMRADLISLAPILNHLIVAGEKYTQDDILINLNYSLEDLDRIYSSHKTVALLFREYHYIFRDDETYLVYLKFYNLIEKLIPILLGISKINRNVDKLEDLTRQLYIISYPIELINGIEKTTKADEILPVDMCRYVELYYFNLVKQIASLKLAK